MDDIIFSYSVPVSDLAISTNVQDLTCIICLNICFKPVMISCCERLMCLECIKLMMKHNSNTSQKCPYCNNTNFKYEKPSKLIFRLFENLTFHCPNKTIGCTDQIKYYFYFDHVYNSCQYKKENKFEFCKCCEIIKINNSNHICGEVIKDNSDEMTENQKCLNSLYNINNNDNNKTSSNSLDGMSITNILPKGTVNIPRLHNHNLVLTNNRLYAGYEQGWVCELCCDNIRNSATKSYHCGSCMYDVCEKCYLYISSKLPNISCHNHGLNLEIRDLQWECNLCQNTYYKRRSWYCDICEFDVCIFCYWKRN